MTSSPSSTPVSAWDAIPHWCAVKRSSVLAVWQTCPKPVLKIADNPVAQLFWGRADLKMATAFCTFDKGGIMQHLMHQLKYQGRKEIGEKLGFLMGTDLIQSPPYREIELLIPVPLHPKREHKEAITKCCIG